MPLTFQPLAEVDVNLDFISSLYLRVRPGAPSSFGGQVFGVVPLLFVLFVVCGLAPRLAVAPEDGRHR